MPPHPEACCSDNACAPTPGLPAACRDVLADPLEFVTQEGSGHFGDMYSVHQGAIIHYAKVWVSANQHSQPLVMVCRPPWTTLCFLRGGLHTTIKGRAALSTLAHGVQATLDHTVLL